MLSTLLPGFREVRTPLVAGYLWLALAWLLLHDQIASPSEATGIVQDLYELSEALGAVGGGFAISLAAYLVGSVALAMTDPAFRWMNESFSSRRGSSVLSERGTNAVRLAALEVVREADAELGGRDSRREYERARLREHLNAALLADGITEMDVQEANRLVSELNALGRPSAELDNFEVIDSILRKRGLSLVAAGPMVDVLRRLGENGFFSLDSGDLRRALASIRRLKIPLEELALHRDVLSGLAKLHLNLGDVEFAEDIESRLQEHDLTLAELAEARAAHVEPALEGIGLTIQSVRKAGKTRQTLGSRWTSGNLRRASGIEKTLQQNSSLSPREVDNATRVASILHAADVSLEEARQLIPLEDYLGKDFTNDLARAVTTTQKLEQLHVSPDPVRRSIGILERAERIRRRVEDSVETEASFDLSTSIIGELDLIATQLVADQPELYSMYDRYRAEAEFRFGLVVPAAALIALFAVRLSVNWILLFLPLAVLFRDGQARRRAAGDILADALQLGTVGAPSVKKFRTVIGKISSNGP